MKYLILLAMLATGAWGSMRAPLNPTAPAPGTFTRGVYVYGNQDDEYNMIWAYYTIYKSMPSDSLYISPDFSRSKCDSALQKNETGMIVTCKMVEEIVRLRADLARPRYILDSAWRQGDLCFLTNPPTCPGHWIVDTVWVKP